MILPARIKRMASYHLRETRGNKTPPKFVIKRATIIKIQLIQWMLISTFPNGGHNKASSRDLQCPSFPFL
ncbi:hypothetical protein BDA96_01G469500 [Sorghum bicolor]|uniref:Uncharacterized protein n=1 Tax=Sorghum bicolor TaxID=4558 RepID=A0A921S5T4_SORBI|nr:hypothetical protein BDA96_01G469500 [Sorghum bicolor]